MKSILAVAVTALFATGAVAQDCGSLTGSQIAPASFDDAVSTLSSSGGSLEKDEFETTAEYEARVAAARTALPTSMLVSLPVDLEHVTYNADKGAFEIKSYAVANRGADWFNAFYGSPHYSTIEHNSYDNLAIVLSSTDQPRGTYTGQNAYGASWEITRIDRTVTAIFESKPPRYGMSLFRNSSTADAPVWELPVHIDQARGFKENIRAAALIAPKAPYFFENTQPSTARVTIQNPRDVTQISRVLIADIQCVAFTDAANNVLLTVRTN